MGIREEIERRIKLLEETGPYPPGEEWMSLKPYKYGGIADAHDATLDTLKDVLSILDEHLGELIEEVPLRELLITKALTGELSNGAMIWLDRELAEPGDHIAIYLRRKKDESSS